MLSRCQRLLPAALVAASSLSFCSLAADALARSGKEPGDLWEVTTKMEMKGMSLPPTTSRVCTPRDWKEPPMAGQEERKCQMVDFSTTGNKSTWKMRCDEPTPMTGEGEITRSADSYSGWMKMSSSQGVMTMNLSGKKVGDCDAAEQKRQMAQTQKGMADAQTAQLAQICATAIQGMQLGLLQAPNTPCGDPALKDQYCKRLATEEGFGIVASRPAMPGDGLEVATAYCGTSADAIKARLCAEAGKSESLEFLAKNCPAETEALAKRECAGRDYTSLTGSKYQGFCVRYAADAMAAANGTQPADGQKDPKESARDKGKKLLKGLFKH